MELYFHSPIRLHGVVLSYSQDTSSWYGTQLSTGTTLPNKPRRKGKFRPVFNTKKTYWGGGYNSTLS
jgi:hypothetical protein